MSDDILKSLNKINISVNTNDQMLWEAQAAAKCITVATDKIKEECDRLKREISNTDEDISSIKPQIQILESNYDVQNENILINQRSLINQRIHKKCIAKKIQKYEEDADKLINEYAQYIQSCKGNLELSNPTFKVLQTKRIELRQTKICCMDLQQTIKEVREINKQKIEIKQQLYYKDIVQFAQKWLEDMKYLEAMTQLEEETRKEREYVKKLAEITERLKQRQVDKVLRNTNCGFNISQLIEFSQNDVKMEKKKITAKVPTSINNSLADIGTMLKKGNAEIVTDSKSKMNLKPAFNRSHSKVRVLENKTVKEAQHAEKPCRLKSKEERSKEIEAKIKKVVENFNKNITRQSSKRTISLSQTSSKSGQNGAKPKPVQQLKENLQKDPYEGSGATQAIQKLSLSGLETKKTESKALSQENKLQFPKQQLPFFNTEKNKSQAISQGRPNENCGSNTFSRNENFLFQAMPNRPIRPIENGNEKTQFLGFNPVFGSAGHSNQATFLNSSDNCEDADHCPVFSPSYCEGSAEDNDTNNKGLGTFSFGAFKSSQFKFS